MKSAVRHIKYRLHRADGAARLLLTAVCAFAALLPVDTSAAARVPRVQATATNLTSNSDRIISYRHQEHLWQTADGAYHIVINRGTLTPGPGLALFSSFDGGTTWSHQLGFAGTADESVSDGQLSGNGLALMFQTADGALVFQRLLYDSATRSWVVTASETAFASTDFAAVNPAITIDAQGTAWCAFVRRDRVTNDVHIRMLVRPAAAGPWLDTGLIFGPTDRRSIERSARPLPTSGGVGMVYTVREFTYWATRLDSQPLEAEWTVTTVLQGTPGFRTTDPYASHFSVLNDDQMNTHLVTIDNYDVLYFRRDAAGGLWTGGGRLDDDKKAGYTQSGIVDGKFAAAWSVQRGLGSAVSSSDGGVSFDAAALLVLPADAPGVSYGQARVEMPSRSMGPLVILQQYTDNGIQRLMLFKVPLP